MQLSSLKNVVHPPLLPPKNVAVIHMHSRNLHCATKIHLFEIVSLNSATKGLINSSSANLKCSSSYAYILASALFLFRTMWYHIGWHQLFWYARFKSIAFASVCTTKMGVVSFVIYINNITNALVKMTHTRCK